MMTLLGVSPAAVTMAGGPAALGDARGRCLECEHSETCAGWLEHTGEAAAAPGFCANAELFADARELSATRRNAAAHAGGDGRRTR